MQYFYHTISATSGQADLTAKDTPSFNSVLPFLSHMTLSARANLFGYFFVRLTKTEKNLLLL